MDEDDSSKTEDGSEAVNVLILLIIMFGYLAPLSLAIWRWALS